MTPEQLEQIEARANAAEGVWGAADIDRALTDISALVAEVRRLQTRLARVEGQYAALLKMDMA